MAGVTSKTSLFVILIFLIFVCIGGIVMVIIFENAYKDIIKNEGALCLTGACQAPSTACENFPFRIVAGSTTPECKSSIFQNTAPIVTPT